MHERKKVHERSPAVRDKVRNGFAASDTVGDRRKDKSPPEARTHTSKGPNKLSSSEKDKQAKMSISKPAVSILT